MGRPSFEQLYRAEYPRMVRVAWLIVGSRHVAEELVQDSFLRIGQRYQQLDDPAAYLRAAVVNACRNDLRRARYRSDQPVPERVAVEQPLDQGDSELFAGLAILETKQRAAIVLRFVDDCHDEQIAQLLGVRRATVRSLVFRGLQRLREVIEPMSDKP